MNKKIDKKDHYLDSLNYICSNQLENGMILWDSSGKFDPWDHIEAAMALTVFDKFEDAKKAYKWLIKNQTPQGGWFSEYKFELPIDRKQETNFAAYFATGIWHYYLITEDKVFLEGCLNTLCNSISFIADLQSKHGDILWALDEYGAPMDDSLITGCSSIYKSLECAEAIFKTFDMNSKEISDLKKAIKDSIKNYPMRFDRTKDRSRYSMDWYYPILCGRYRDNEGQIRLESKWKDFVVKGLGCICVEEEPWVTIAESSELVMALMNLGEANLALELFSWLDQWKDKDNVYWTGYVYPDKAFWPEEKPTWTCGAVILAADSIYKFSKGSELFLKDWSL